MWDGPEANRLSNAMRHNQYMNPNRECLVLWNSTVDAIKQFLVLVLNCLSSDIALGGGARKSATLDDNDMFGGGYAFMDVAARVELPRSPDNFFLEFLSVHGALLRSLNEQSRGRSAVANDNALENQFATRGADVVLDRPELADGKRL